MSSPMWPLSSFDSSAPEGSLPVRIRLAPGSTPSAAPEFAVPVCIRLASGCPLRSPLRVFGFAGQPLPDVDVLARPLRSGLMAKSRLDLFDHVEGPVVVKLLQLFKQARVRTVKRVRVRDRGFGLSNTRVPASVQRRLSAVQTLPHSQAARSSLASVPLSRFFPVVIPLRPVGRQMLPV